MYHFPDYSNSLVSLSNSILAKFGVPTATDNRLHLLDDVMQKDYRNTVVFLIDGMGTKILNHHLAPYGFFRSHFRATFSSVFPPTTVAATTSLLSGKTPAEHAWLGWDCYYPQIDKTVTVFRNTETQTEIPAADYPVAKTFCPYTAIITQIQQAGGHAYYASPFEAPNPQTLPDICERIITLCRQPERKFIYAYWTEPDSTMHEKGCLSADATEVLRSIEAEVQSMAEQLEDTLLIFVADHGQIDTRGDAFPLHPELTECLERITSIEPRAINLFVKPDKTKLFEERWKQAFGDQFLLLPMEEVLRTHLFGPGTEHPNLRGMLGNYLAVALSDLTVYQGTGEMEFFVGVHAGMTPDELDIPLIVVEK